MPAPCQSSLRPVTLMLLLVPFAPSSTTEMETSPRFSIGSVLLSSIVVFTRTAGVGSGVASPAGVSVGAAVGSNPGPFTSAILFASLISSKYTDTDFVPFVGSLDSCGFVLGVADTVGASDTFGVADTVGAVGASDTFGVADAVGAFGVAVTFAPPGVVDVCGFVEVCGVTVVWLFFFTRTFTTPIFRFLPFFETSLTVIFAVPAATAFTFPFLVTVATFFLLEVNV